MNAIVADVIAAVVGLVYVGLMLRVVWCSRATSPDPSPEPTPTDSTGPFPFWISWYATDETGPFTLNTPWWVSASGDDVEAICAAIVATDDDDAKRQIVAAHDRKDVELEWRFVMKKSTSWSPFSERFSRADWMEWADGPREDNGK